jgi:hypothetical protein
MMLGIALKPENLNPIHEMKIKRRSIQQMSNFCTVVFEMVSRSHRWNSSCPLLRH